MCDDSSHGPFPKGPACCVLLNNHNNYTSNAFDGVQAVHSMLTALKMARVLLPPVSDTPADQYLFLVSGETRRQ